MGKHTLGSTDLARWREVLLDCLWASVSGEGSFIGEVEERRSPDDDADKEARFPSTGVVAVVVAVVVGAIGDTPRLPGGVGEDCDGEVDEVLDPDEAARNPLEGVELYHMSKVRKRNVNTSKDIRRRNVNLVLYNLYDAHTVND